MEIDIWLRLQDTFNEMIRELWGEGCHASVEMNKSVKKMNEKASVAKKHKWEHMNSVWRIICGDVNIIRKDKWDIMIRQNYQRQNDNAYEQKYFRSEISHLKNNVIK